jgi:putative copper export protein
LRVCLLFLQMGDGAPLPDFSLLELAWSTLSAPSLALAAGATAVALGALMGWRVLLVVGAVLSAASFGLTGHTQGLSDPGLAPAASGLHVLIAGFWIVAPLTLWPRDNLTDPNLLARLHRFSASAVAAIPVMMLVGVWLAWRLTGGIGGLLYTVYGQLLLVKLGVALAALGAGAINKQVVTAKVGQTAATGRLWLRRTLACEALLFAAAILAVSAATTFTGAGE